jgi:hypothetical protein
LLAAEVEVEQQVIGDRVEEVQVVIVLLLLKLYLLVHTP